MQMKSAIFWGLFTAMGLLFSGCATTSDNDMGSFKSPSRLWWDDLAFHSNQNGTPPDWEILDLSQESFENWGYDWNNIQTDAFDIIR
ncbi:MAG: hypothetical protein ACP5I1_02885 [Candidatus Hinthialibacter sp.]